MQEQPKVVAVLIFAPSYRKHTPEIQSSGAIEHHYVDWIAILTWEILRLRRIKAELINCALFEALKNLLKHASK
jgi:hypothetical protein